MTWIVKAGLVTGLIASCISGLGGLPAKAAMNPDVSRSPYDCENLRDQERRLMEQWYERCFIPPSGEWLDPQCDKLRKQLDELDAKIRKYCSGSTQPSGQVAE